MGGGSEGGDGGSRMHRAELGTGGTARFRSKSWSKGCDGGLDRRRRTHAAEGHEQQHGGGEEERTRRRGGERRRCEEEVRGESGRRW
eukprot:755640-Hanusia_phi.AAC.2